jgi:hypothetical protein
MIVKTNEQTPSGPGRDSLPISSSFNYIVYRNLSNRTYGKKIMKDVRFSGKGRQ